ncbi:MAG: hypothetical protein D3917_10310, partial [Candidatus Electrothrix sp. AX5]|nr:hypothetical protein [Candidatus Electrothrix sp. AX5]
MEYQQIMQDRERALPVGILTRPTTVKAKLRYKNDTYKIKLRLKGNLKGHWVAKKRLSLRIKLKGEKTILGYKEFSLHKPRERQHPIDPAFQSISRRMGNLSAQNSYIRVFVNGDSWGVM